MTQRSVGPYRSRTAYLASGAENHSRAYASDHVGLVLGHVGEQIAVPTALMPSADCCFDAFTSGVLVTDPVDFTRPAPLEARSGTRARRVSSSLSPTSRIGISRDPSAAIPLAATGHHDTCSQYRCVEVKWRRQEWSVGGLRYCLSVRARNANDPSSGTDPAPQFGDAGLPHPSPH